jgi:hypothetical protein
VIKVGDSVGNADPYIGAGLGAALVDSDRAVRLLTSTAPDGALAKGGLATDIVDGHRTLIRQADLIRHTRSLALRLLPAAHLDEQLSPSDAGRSPGLSLVVQIVNRLPLPGAHHDSA